MSHTHQYATMNFIIRPDGFEIPLEASAIHGITQERALREGIDIHDALQMFNLLALRADEFVGHNVDFDLLMVKAEVHRQKMLTPFGDKPSFCTMRQMTNICQIPSPYRAGEWKWPKLQEAYKHAFGEEFSSAHDAMADISATARLYIWLKNNHQTL